MGKDNEMIDSWLDVVVVVSGIAVVGLMMWAIVKGRFR